MRGKIRMEFEQIPLNFKSLKFVNENVIFKS